MIAGILLHDRVIQAVSLPKPVLEVRDPAVDALLRIEKITVALKGIVETENLTLSRD